MMTVKAGKEYERGAAPSQELASGTGKLTQKMTRPAVLLACRAPCQTGPVHRGSTEFKRAASLTRSGPERELLLARESAPA
jgi:hypothetical protein